MSTGLFKVPQPTNEPIYSYAVGSSERQLLQDTLHTLRNKQVEVSMRIHGKSVQGSKKVAMTCPHDHQHILGYYYEGGKIEIAEAIESALSAKAAWAALTWQERVSIFLKAADLSANKYRMELNARTMLGQSKNAYQAEIDSACEWVDFLRFNAHYAAQIYADQPISSPGVWNRLEYRPLEGFVYALTPFNFTAIAGNLPAAPAMMGNTVVWKPAPQQIYSAALLMQILEEAGLPAGVINLVFADGPEAGEVVFSHRDFAGIHFTGSTKVFQTIWQNIGNNIANYKSYPRIVGETGGKDFVLAHASADVKALVTGLIRGAFEYQGQKCSAASRAYVPASLWPAVKSQLQSDLAKIKVGGTEDFGNFVNAVIDQKAFDKITSYIQEAKNSKEVEVIAGGGFDASRGYFVEPTVLLTTNPHYRTMEEEIFGPVLSIYVYPDQDWKATLNLVDQTSAYALTGAIFSQDAYALSEAAKALENAAGNLYLNDKCTGAVVGQQPFGGARASGTNDKAGSYLNLLRWVSPRTVKEVFSSPTDFKYPFLG
ncbi:L-glutamate gamma-semialdehyde dehydrogenase [Aquirufa ecclesiirivi]|uniref:L-glutamate gamma-semialdehyde dehydrogenase n=1 Tax=Aquirufa ecclesiirivi TaxID=2715124 RepID=UPI0023D87D1C|nr:L-glutamate gamma-semialdehyde dehydrogenase [Aquirufa ecclesiirivi]MDF0692929.1 L-glutamate gamma-semialdehyde dehydrogenase [Aquirufa ecclesiirivi]